jgi:formylmethanofuran dehydrogenase subunit B
MPSTAHHDVTCPFCGLLCDDLTVVSDADQLTVSGGGCARSDAGFDAPAGPAEPLVDGGPASLHDAVARAAGILRAAALPLYGGLGTDVAGMRAVLALADRTGGVLDHMHGESTLHNVLAMQDAGWMITTLTEVRNRADVLVLAGTDATGRIPRFFERLVWNPETLFGQSTAAREIVYLGTGLDTSAGHAPDGRPPTVVPCERARLGEVAAVLRALLAGRPLRRASLGGVALEELAGLAARLQAARYGVLAWSAADLDGAHADLTVQALAELVRELNRTTRWAGLPLGGEDGATTAAQVCTWQSGYPLRVGFGRGYPDYDPWRHATGALLASGTADALLWISAFDREAAPPAAGPPTIVLGRPGMAFARPPAVYIPVGTPGLDHAGQLCRMDSVVTLPLRALRATGLPSVADVLDAIRREL